MLARHVLLWRCATSLTVPTRDAAHADAVTIPGSCQLPNPFLGHISSQTRQHLPDMIFSIGLLLLFLLASNSNVLEQRPYQVERMHGW